jgi:hypothetical protein
MASYSKLQDPSTRMLRSGFGAQVKSTQESCPSVGFGSSHRDASVKVNQCASQRQQLAAAQLRLFGARTRRLRAVCAPAWRPDAAFSLVKQPPPDKALLRSAQQYISPEHARAMGGNNSQGPVYKTYVSVDSCAADELAPSRVRTAHGVAAAATQQGPKTALRNYFGVFASSGDLTCTHAPKDAHAFQLVSPHLCPCLPPSHPL